MLIFKCILTYKQKPATHISIIEDDDSLRSFDGAPLENGCLNWLLNVKEISHLFNKLGLQNPDIEKQYQKDVTDVVYSISIIEDSLLIDNNNINQLNHKEINNIINAMDKHLPFIALFGIDDITPPVSKPVITSEQILIEEPASIQESLTDEYANSCVTGESDDVSPLPPMVINEEIPTEIDAATLPPLEIDIPPLDESLILQNEPEPAAIEPVEEIKPKKSRKSKKSAE